MQEFRISILIDLKSLTDILINFDKIIFFFQIINKSITEQQLQSEYSQLLTQPLLLIEQLIMNLRTDELRIALSILIPRKYLKNVGSSTANMASGEVNEKSKMSQEVLISGNSSENNALKISLDICDDLVIKIPLLLEKYALIALYNLDGFEAYSRETSTKTLPILDDASDDEFSNQSEEKDFKKAAENPIRRPLSVRSRGIS